MVVLALVLLALVAVERFGRTYAEGEIAGRLRNGGVTGDIGVTVGSSWWRPAVLPALVTGDLDRVEVDVANGSLAGVRVDSARYVLSGLHGVFPPFNGTVAVRSLDRGSVVMRIPPEVIGQSIGVPVVVRNGDLLAGDPLAPLDVQVVGDSLVFSGRALASQGRPQPVPVADPYLLPCRPRVGVARGALQLACTGTTVPGILQAALQGDDPGGDGVAPVGELPPPQSTDRPGG